MKKKQMEYQLLVEEDEKLMFKHLLKWYKKSIRDNYYVTGLVKIEDGDFPKWVVRLERTLDSYGLSTKNRKE